MGTDYVICGNGLCNMGTDYVIWEWILLSVGMDLCNLWERIM